MSTPLNATKTDNQVCPEGKIFLERQLTLWVICAGEGTGCYKCAKAD